MIESGWTKSECLNPLNQVYVFNEVAWVKEMESRIKCLNPLNHVYVFNGLERQVRFEVCPKVPS